MRRTIDPGRERRSINVVEDVIFSRPKNLSGNPIELKMTLYLQNGNSEMRLADGRDDEVNTGKQPVILWMNGAGWRECGRLLMGAEMQFLAEAGYAVVFADYRHSGLGHFPAQVEDLKTAIRFLRANADKYGLDAAHIGCIGRSAGGHLATWLAMNTDDFETEEWQGYSDHVQAAVNMFGPVDLEVLARNNMEKIKDPSFRWHRMVDTHEGAYLGCTDDMSDEEILAAARKASPIHAISEAAAPITILHGDQDPTVPLQNSEALYKAFTDAGLERQTDFYILQHGGHGTREFFQAETKGIITKFFDRYLKSL